MNLVQVFSLNQQIKLKMLKIRVHFSGELAKQTSFPRKECEKYGSKLWASAPSSSWSASFSFGTGWRSKSYN